MARGMARSVTGAPSGFLEITKRQERPASFTIWSPRNCERREARVGGGGWRRGELGGDEQEGGRERGREIDGGEGEEGNKGGQAQAS